MLLQIQRAQVPPPVILKISPLLRPIAPPPPKKKRFLVEIFKLKLGRLDNSSNGTETDPDIFVIQLTKYSLKVFIARGDAFDAF